MPEAEGFERWVTKIPSYAQGGVVGVLERGLPRPLGAWSQGTSWPPHRSPRTVTATETVC